MEAVWEQIPDEYHGYVVPGAALVVLVVTFLLTLKNVDIPGPFEIPFGLGHIYLMGAAMTSLLDMTVEYAFRHGWQSVTVAMPLKERLVFVFSPKSVEAVLKGKFKSMIKGPPFYNNTSDLLGNGIFATDGHTWYVQRKTASHMFAGNVFKETMVPAFHEHAGILRAQLEARADEGKVVDIQERFFAFTLDSIAKIAFDFKTDTLLSPDSPFARAFDGAQSIVMDRFINPLWWVTELFTADGAKIRHSIKVLDETCKRIIHERRDSGSYKTGRDVLSRFMRLEDADGNPSVLHDDRYLRDVVLNYIIAGRDTTAQALTWTVYMLAQHPDAERRLLDEIDAALPDGQMPTLEEVRALPFVEACVKETLRLYPSVPKDAKFATADTTLPDGTPIKKGFLVVYQPAAMGRCPELWGADCMDWRPERFLTQGMPTAFEYPVFNAGPRTCLGQRMALVEATMVITTLYQHFVLRLQPSKVSYVNSLTLPSTGMPVRVFRRRDAEGRPLQVPPIDELSPKDVAGSDFCRAGVPNNGLLAKYSALPKGPRATWAVQNASEFMKGSDFVRRSREDLDRLDRGERPSWADARPALAARYFGAGAAAAGGPATSRS